MKTQLPLSELEDGSLELVFGVYNAYARLLRPLASPAAVAVFEEIVWAIVDELRPRRAGEAVGVPVINVPEPGDLPPNEQQLVCSELEHLAEMGSRHSAFVESLRVIGRAIADLAPAAPPLASGIQHGIGDAT